MRRNKEEEGMNLNENERWRGIQGEKKMKQKTGVSR